MAGTKKGAGTAVSAVWPDYGDGEHTKLLGAHPQPVPSMCSRLDAATRPGFIRKVYGILSLQLFLTFGVIFVCVYIEGVKRWMCGVRGDECLPGPGGAAPLRGLYPRCNLVQGGGCAAPTPGLSAALYASMGMSFVFLFAIACCGDLARKVPHNYLLLFSFTLCEAVVLAVICLFSSMVAVGLASLMTCMVTAGLTAFAHYTTIDFTGFGAYLYAALLSFVVCGFVGSWFSAWYGVAAIQSVYAGGGCLLFSCYIVYDTQLIVGGTHRKHQFGVDDYVFAALNIYLDSESRPAMQLASCCTLSTSSVAHVHPVLPVAVINLFLYILQLLSKRD
jgi:FtsH-binding integral membrane protein